MLADFQACHVACGSFNGWNDGRAIVLRGSADGFFEGREYDRYIASSSVYRPIDCRTGCATELSQLGLEVKRGDNAGSFGRPLR